MKMSVKERALRYALKLFEDESKWEHESSDGMGFEGALCVGLALIKGRRVCLLQSIQHGALSWDNGWLNDVMQMAPDGGAEVASWNDEECPDISALRAKLKSRIAHYEQERLAKTPIAVIILGPGQNIRRL